MSKSPTFTTEQYAAILASHNALAVERDGGVGERRALLEKRAGLRSELRVLTTERDLYHERLKLFQRRLFAAKSAMRASRTCSSTRPRHWRQTLTRRKRASWTAWSMFPPTNARVARSRRA